MRQARHDNALVGLNAIPDPERELVHWSSAMLACAVDALILEMVVADAGEGSADLLDDPVAESWFTRFVVVLRVSDVPFSSRETRYGAKRNVTFPAREYSVNGERRSFALLRPVADTNAHDAVRQAILEAYEQTEAGIAQAS